MGIGLLIFKAERIQLILGHTIRWQFLISIKVKLNPRDIILAIIEINWTFLTISVYTKNHQGQLVIKLISNKSEVKKHTVWDLRLHILKIVQIYLFRFFIQWSRRKKGRKRSRTRIIQNYRLHWR